jgi:type IV secretion system protein VirB10
MTRSPDGPAKSEPDGLELRPRPRTTRLNRNALVLGGAIGAAVLGAAAATLVESRTAIAPAGEAAHVAAAGADRFWEKEPDGVPQRAYGDGLPEVSAGPPPEPNVVPVATSSGGGLDPETQRRRERLLRAREAAPLVAGFRSGDLAQATPAASVAAASGTGRPASLDAHPALLGALGQVLQGKDELLRQNNQDAKRAFLEGSGVSEQEETNPFLVRKPISPYEVTAGTILPAVLITQGDSDLPGLMTGRVRENVYDSATGRHLLVPQGTTIVGVYDSVVTFGQQRLLIAWQRLLFPDGTKLNIGGMPGADLLGAAGFNDEVDRHYKRIFGSALLLSVMTAGVTLSQENDNGSGLGDEGSTRDQVKSTLATALGQSLGEAASQMLRREMNVQPTLRIRPGYRFNVLVNKDLIFEGPYLNTFVGGGIVP